MTARPSLPPPPAPVEPPGFPLLGALAPVLVAAVLFAATRSPAVLLFAVFSPVLAVAAVVDGRLQSSRRARRAARARTREIDVLEQEVDALLAARAAEAHRRAPGPPADTTAGADATVRPTVGPVVLGTADLPIEPVLDGRAADDRERALLRRAAVLPAAPVVLPPDCAVTVSGVEPYASAARRALAAQRPGGGAGDLLLAVQGPETALVERAGGAAAPLSGLALAPLLLTAASAEALAARDAVPVPDLAELLTGPLPAAGLAARFLVADGDGEALDLAADGPHALVAGTTGSGKSALLTAWVLALAAAHPPDEVALLLVDCKGGAAFDPLAALPHVTGVLTDLDGAGAARAVLSLRAELRRREHVLRERGVADAARTDEPRLVVVVDEFRALLEAAPELAAVFTDVAARGRSLGVHLVLCTQRPAGVVRDDVLANCGLRIALRVHDTADSVAVVGSAAAARIERGRPGAAVAVVDGEPARPVQVARVDPGAVPDLVRAVAHLHRGAPRARACWLAPLPDRLPLEALLGHPAATDAVVLGLQDVPEQQAQPPLLWHPSARRRLLVVGDAGSGRSTALATVAAQLDVALASSDPAAAWDRLHDDDRALVVNDLDLLLDALGPAHGAAALDHLVRRMRVGGAPVVLSLRAPSAWAGAPLRPLLGLADELLVLGTTLDDHLALGGDRSTWRASRAPGAGTWRGRSVQVALPDAAPARDAGAHSAPFVPDAGPVALVTSSPDARTARLRDAGLAVGPADGVDDTDLLVGGAPAWQAQWSRLGRIAASGTVLVDRVEAADLRALLGVRDVLPPVTHPDDIVVLRPERAPERRRLPVPPGAAFSAR